MNKVFVERICHGFKKLPIRDKRERVIEIRLSSYPLIIPAENQRTRAPTIVYACLALLDSLSRLSKCGAFAFEYGKSDNGYSGRSK